MSETSSPALPGATRLNLLGVDYAHMKTGDGGDLYLTRFGEPFAEHLKPESWFGPGWFELNREKLEGTSTVYRIRTRPVGGRSKDIVVKWCRVGTEIPMDTFTLTKFVEAEFNSPYEEFALVMEMRADRSRPRLHTHKPLAIYAPAKRLKLWQTKRDESRMERKKAKFRDVELDIFRQYILIYEWVKGVSLPQAFPPTPDDAAGRLERLRRHTDAGVRDLAEKGFQVLDIKPEHLIVRPKPGGSVLRRRDGRIAYALVDFELLQRTPAYERRVAAARRAAYLQHQKDRINLVWKVSRVGEVPDLDPADARGACIREYGYNSPFEEFSFAIRLARAGVPVVYPRAIYMTGQEASGAATYAADTRRYDRDAAVVGPDGRPVLRRDHNYIAVWGYWNGSDETLAMRDVDVCVPIDLARALAGDRIGRAEHDELLAEARETLAGAGFEDLNPEGGHLLLSQTPRGGFQRGDNGRYVLRWCNFSLVRPLRGGKEHPPKTS
ncbi:MAG: hypothetical protein BWK77_03210 [Verrucomicrobia bacterium A1]|nr:MAG: hypothetical protein BWK77_03210 [Verrucomicrobia bacterium A1]